jgi:polar amino acid transport system substrate-binding protein
MNTRTRTTARRAAALAAVAALTLTACGTGTATGTETAAPTAAPAAVPVAAPPKELPPCEQDGKDPRASKAPGGSVAQLALKAKDDLINQTRLIVGTSADVMLWGARDPKSGQLVGFDISLAHEIARDLLGNPNAVEFRVINYSQRLPALGATPIKGEQKSQPVDIVLHTMTINCARWKRVQFSAEYYSAGQRVLVRADDPAYLKKKEGMQITDLAPGAKVCVPAASTNVENLEANYKEVYANRVEVPEIGECLVMFQRGEVDAITGDDTVLAGFAVQDPYAKVVGEQISVEPYGVGVGAQHTNLTRLVNATLERLATPNSDGKIPWQEIYRTTMGQAVPKVPDPPDRRYGR